MTRIDNSTGGITNAQRFSGAEVRDRSAGTGGQKLVSPAVERDTLEHQTVQHRDEDARRSKLGDGRGDPIVDFFRRLFGGGGQPRDQTKMGPREPQRTPEPPEHPRIEAPRSR